MTRAKLLVLGLGLALIAIFAAPAASAQDGPAITVEPANVDAAGDVEFTITGTGWTAAPPIFVLPCTATTLDELTATGADTCDTAALTPATPADGAFEVTVTYTVPEEGMCIAAGDAGQTESGGACITVGGGDAAAEEEAAGEEAAAEEEGAEEEAVAEEAAADEELATTGVESGQVAIIALAMLGAGAMAVGYTRRFA